MRAGEVAAFGAYLGGIETSLLAGDSQLTSLFGAYLGGIETTAQR